MLCCKIFGKGVVRFSLGLPLAVLPAGCDRPSTSTSPPAGVPQGATWAKTNRNFAMMVAAEKAPEDREELRAVAVDASATPAQRAAALRELGRQKDFESMPVVIEALNDEVQQVRGEAYDAATRIVGTGVKLRAYDSAERRRPAIEAYQRLYALAQENQVRHFIDLVPVLLTRMDAEDVAVRRQAGEDIVRLMDASYNFQADGPREARLRAIAEFRREWDEWKAPGSQMVEIRRDPEKMRAFKEKLLQEIREKEARGVPFTTDTKARDAAAEAAGGAK